MPDPMYRQIAEDPRKQIESGALGHGDQLPTEPELRETYDASRNTVRDAVKWLITRGLVETRPGQGSFVVGKIDPYVTILTGEPEKSGDEEGPVYAKGTRGAGRGGRRKPATSAFDHHGQPFRLTISVYPADRNQFVIEVGEVPDAEASAGADPRLFREKPLCPYTDRLPMICSGRSRLASLARAPSCRRKWNSGRSTMHPGTPSAMR